jgi:hypothetical protein
VSLANPVSRIYREACPWGIGRCCVAQGIHPRAGLLAHILNMSQNHLTHIITRSGTKQLASLKVSSNSKYSLII